MNRGKPPTQVILSGKWIVCGACSLLSLFMWIQIASNSWNVFQLNQRIPILEEQVREARRLLEMKEKLSPVTNEALPLTPSLERLLESVLQKPESVSIQVVRASTQEIHSGEAIITQLIISGEASSVARVLQRLEEQEAGLLVTSLRVSPGFSESTPTRWIVDGVLL